MKLLLVFSGLLLLFALSGAVPISSCQTISNPGTYTLTQDLTAARTCMVIRSNDVVLDLGGHTITYSALPATVIPNAGFETAGSSSTTAASWDFSAAPTITRSTGFPAPVGSWVGGELGTYAVKLPAGSSGQYIYSQAIAVTPGNAYELSALVTDSANVLDYSAATSQLDITVYETANGQGCRMLRARYADNWAANKCTFTPTTATVKIKIGMASPAGADTFVDALQLGEDANPAYGTGTNSHYAIYVGPNRNHVRITNGRVAEGNSGAFNARAIALDGGTFHEIDHITFNAFRPESTGLNGGGSDFSIHDNTVSMSTTRIHYSHESAWYEGAFVLNFATNAKIFNNVIQRAPNGISIQRNSANNEIYGNTINVVDSGIHAWAIASSAFNYPTESNTGLKIHDNIINNAQGSGIFLEAGTVNSQIYNNYVEIRDGPQEERDWTGKALWSRYDVGGLDIYGNTFIAHGGRNVVRPNSDASAVGVRLGGNGAVAAPILFHNNIVTADTNLDSAATFANAIELSSDSGTGVSKQFYGNTFTSNHHIVTLGETYSYSNYNTLHDNLFIKPATALATFKTMQIGWSGGFNNIFQDNTMQGGADLHAVNYPGSTQGYQFDVRWTLTLNVKDASNIAISGATVQVKDRNGNVVSTGTTDATGKFSAALIEQSISASTGGPTTTAYNPFTYTVQKSGYNTLSQAVTMDQTKSLALTLSTAGSTCINGAIQSCITAQSCPGTQTCSNNVWSACTDVPNDNCPLTTPTPTATVTTTPTPTATVTITPTATATPTPSPTTCTPNAACTTLAACPGVCASDGSVCMDTSSDGCPVTSGTPISVSFQNGVSPGGYAGQFDAAIVENTPSTTTTSGLLQTRFLPGFTTRNLFKFDVSSIPSTASVTSATVHFTVSDNGGASTAVNIYRLLKAWTVPGATWTCTNDAGQNGCVSPEIAWAVSGATGSADATLLANPAFATGDNSVTVTSAVQQWVTSGSSNFGLLLAETVGTYKVINGATHWTPGSRPKLDVTYTMPATCTPNWVYSGWSTCSGGTQTRQASDLNDCGTTNGRQALSQSCTNTITPTPTVTVTNSPTPTATITLTPTPTVTVTVTTTPTATVTITPTPTVTVTASITPTPGPTSCTANQVCTTVDGCVGVCSPDGSTCDDVPNDDCPVPSTTPTPTPAALVCTPNTACTTTEDHCPGTCSSDGAQCLDIANDGCPSVGGGRGGGNGGGNGGGSTHGNAGGNGGGNGGGKNPLSGKNPIGASSTPTPAPEPSVHPDVEFVTVKETNQQQIDQLRKEGVSEEELQAIEQQLKLSEQEKANGNLNGALNILRNARSKLNTLLQKTQTQKASYYWPPLALAGLVLVVIGTAAFYYSKTQKPPKPPTDTLNMEGLQLPIKQSQALQTPPGNEPK